MVSLIILDCQNDFITGTLGKKGVKNVLEPIKKYIKSHKDEIKQIIFVCDWHPYDHCSFKNFGGDLIHHCVQFTPGACIEPKLLKLVHSLKIPNQVCLKGESDDDSDLQVFYDIDKTTDALGTRYYLNVTTVLKGDTDVVICGINESTIKSAISKLIEAGISCKLLNSGIYLNSDGKDFYKFIKNNQIEKIND